MFRYTLIGLIVLLLGGWPHPTSASEGYGGIRPIAQNLTTWRPGDTVVLRFFCETEQDVRELIAEADDYAVIAQAKITSGDCTYIEFQYPFVLGRYVAGPFQAPSDNNGSIWTFGNGEREWFFWLRDDTGPN